MRATVAKVSTALVCSLAVLAVVINQTARAQQRGEFTPVTIFRADRITSADPGFRYAAAAILSPVRQSVIDPSQGASETSVLFSSLYKDFFTETAVTKKVGDVVSSKISRLTPGQLAIAETLFTQTDISKSKSLVVTPNGIIGSVTPQEVNVTATQLKQLTIQRLQTEVKTATAAASELQR